MKKYVFSAVVILMAIYVAVPSNTYGSRSAKEIGMDTLKRDGIDPVCKMKVKAGNTRTHIHDKIVYGFCSDACKKSFVKQPEKYLKK